MPAIGTPTNYPTVNMSTNVRPPDPRYVWSGQTGYVLKTTAGQSPRPLTLDEAIQQQQREREKAEWASWEALKRHTEKKYAPSPSSVTSHQSSPSIRATQYSREGSSAANAREEAYQEQQRKNAAALAVGVRELYHCLVHGDPQTPRTIPFDFAQAHGLFTDEVALLIHQAEEKTRQERQKFHESYFNKQWNYFIHDREYKVERLERQLEELQAKIRDTYSPTGTIRALYNQYYGCLRERKKIFNKIDVSMLEHRPSSDPKLRVDNDTLSDSILANLKYIWVSPRVYSLYVYLLSYPDLWNLVAPHTAAQFEPWSRLLLTKTSHYQRPHFYKDRRHTPLGQLIDLIHVYLKQPDTDFPFFLKPDVVKKLIKFLEDYKEAAFVMLVLIYLAVRGYDSDERLPILPGIVGTEPIEVLRLIKKLNDSIRLNWNDDIVLKYYERRGYHRGKNTHEYINELCRSTWFCLGASKFDMPHEKRKEVQFLKTTLQARWDWFHKHHPTAASQWVRLDELTCSYLLCRACDLVYFSESVANSTFPQPTGSEAQELVSALVCLLNDTEARLVEAKQRVRTENLRLEEAKKREEIERECLEKMGNISIGPPDNLDPRVLSENEIEILKEACLSELSQSEK